MDEDPFFAFGFIGAFQLGDHPVNGGFESVHRDEVVDIYRAEEMAYIGEFLGRVSFGINIRSISRAGENPGEDIY